MKKYFVIILLTFLCFGCEATYKLEINKDLTVDETIVGLENDEFYASYTGKSKDWVIEAILWNIRDIINSNNYQTVSETQGELYGEKAYKTYSSIDEYLQISNVYPQLYDTFNHSNENGIVTFELKNRLPINYDSLTRFKIDKAKIIMKIPFKVLEHNADSVDFTTHTYTWNISANDDKEIYIKFNSKKVLREFNDYLPFIVVGIIIIIGIIIISKFNKMQREANKI